MHSPLRQRFGLRDGNVGIGKRGELAMWATAAMASPALSVVSHAMRVRRCRQPFIPSSSSADKVSIVSIQGAYQFPFMVSTWLSLVGVLNSVKDMKFS